MWMTMPATRRAPARAPRLPRAAFAAACALLTFLLLALGHRALVAGWPAAVGAWAQARLYAASAAGGLVLRQVEIAGNAQTARATVLAALGVEIGMPILAIDLAAAQERLLSESWIARATIERRLPDALHVAIEERRPAALWQQDGRFALIDHSGTVITRNGLGRFRDLPQLVGPDAPLHAGPLLDALKGAPELRARLEAATRVGGRRWSLYFAGGLEVKLPEDDVAGAVERLARMQRQGALFARDLRVVDLRVPDRMVVRPAPRPALAAGRP